MKIYFRNISRADIRGIIELHIDGTLKSKMVWGDCAYTLNSFICFASCIPCSVITKVSAPFHNTRRVTLGDSSRLLFPIYYAAIVASSRMRAAAATRFPNDVAVACFIMSQFYSRPWPLEPIPPRCSPLYRRHNTAPAAACCATGRSVNGPHSALDALTRYHAPPRF